MNSALQRSMSDPWRPSFHLASLQMSVYGLLGPQGHPPDGPEPPNPDPDPANPVFSKIRIVRFFEFLSLKALQYGCLWTRLDPTRSPVPVLRYLTVLFGT